MRELQVILRHTEKLQRAIAATLRRWPQSAIAAAAPMRQISPGEIIRPMPRREDSHAIASVHRALPRPRRIVIKAGIMRPLVRLFVWVWGAIRFFSGNTVDVILLRDSVQGRAIRLRRVFEDTGASFVKLGQQLSTRADMLPYAYCSELSKMLDQTPPFPTLEAIMIIERNVGRPLNEIFEAFDPEPIGSASLACVYQAKLKTGERVAVKVRRPGIGNLIAADLRVLDWLMTAAETLTLIRPGLTARFRQDLRTILFDELNFRAEARYTDLFRRRAKKHGYGVTAPRVYFQYCTEEVMVSELVSGVWMWELMAAVDSNDREFLSKARGIGIEPKSLARKLVFVMLREVLEELFFHADPHPANLIVLPNNRICFIDFGAIGRFSNQTRRTLLEMQHHVISGNVDRLASSSLSLSGPLPPIDVDRLRTRMEQIYADWIYAINSKDAQWWERSTAQLWLRYIEVAQEFAIPANLETLQYFRATLLYDTIVTRLNKKIDFVREHILYLQDASRRARKRVQTNFRKRLTGPTDADYLQLEHFADATTLVLFRLQRSVENPIIHFRNIVGKIAYAVSLLLRLGYVATVTVGTTLLTDIISKRWFAYEIDWSSIVEAATSSVWVQLTSIVVGLLLIRRIVIRTSMPESRLDSGR